MGLRTSSLLGMLALAVSCAGADRASVDAEAARSSERIEWHDWTPEPFALARSTDKMIIVDVGMEGCTACRWMDEDTYRNDEVVGLINEHFVAIQVDGEARPDVGERYYAWAWPATIFMSPDGEQVLALRGNKRPRNFLPILEDLIAKKTAGTLEPDDEAPEGAVGAPVAEDMVAARDRVVAQLDRFYDPRLGGWGTRQRLPMDEPLQHAFFRAHVLDEPGWRDRALQTLDGMGRIIDPVWGGIFVASIGDWDSLIPEKRMAGNTGALGNYATAYELTGEERWLEHAMEVDRYLREVMLSERGTFFTSQEDDAAGLPGDMHARDYYALPDEERRRYGLPPVDHAEYTDLNARAIRAYVRLYEATGEQKALELAARTGGVLVAERQTEQGWFVHATDTATMQSDERMRGAYTGQKAFLLAQGQMGLALLALHGATGDARWLSAAVKLAQGSRRALEDAEHGGFFASEPDEMDAVAPRRKPVEPNAVMAQFLFRLATLTRDEAQRERALRAVRAVAQVDAVRDEGRLIGNLALALDLMATGTLEFTVVGRRGDPDADALFAAGLREYDPRKVLHYEAAGRYPDRGRPAMYICNDAACSRPIEDPAQIPAEAARFRVQ